MTTTEIPRDRWNRPLILPPPSPVPVDDRPIAYTRVSTLAKQLREAL